MDHAFVLCLIGVGANLVGMLAFYSAASHFLARMAWGRGGVTGLILLIVLSQLFWIPAAVLITIPNEFVGGTAFFSGWFGNWIVTGFALVVLQRSARSIPRSLEDTARLDGMGALGTWRHVVLPFVKRDLMCLAIFLLMALLMASWCFVLLPNEMTHLVTVLQRTETLRQHFGLVTAASVFGAIPLVGIFFASRKN